VQVALTTLRLRSRGDGYALRGRERRSRTDRARQPRPGHAYTVWFFYLQAGATPSPGRFDSAVVAEDEATFAGHVGMQLPSGSTIELLTFDHKVASSDPNTVTITSAGR
jgi:hypothetical protein